MAAIARGTAPEGLSGDEALVVRYVQELLQNRKISDGAFNAVMSGSAPRTPWTSPVSSATTCWWARF